MSKSLFNFFPILIAILLVLAICAPANAYAIEFSLSDLGNESQEDGIADAVECEVGGETKTDSYSLQRQTDKGFPITAQALYSDAKRELDMINEYRVQAGVPKLIMNEALQNTAMLRAAELTLSFSHTRPNGTRCFTAFPPGNNAEGENIAYHYYPSGDNATIVTNMWMNSSAHRENILSSRYKSVGIGCVYYNGAYWWAQCFGDATSEGYAGTSDHSQTFYIPLYDASEVPDYANLMFRMYNPNSGEHFYTSSDDERNNLVYAGWNFEGGGWLAPASVNSEPVYRLYSGTDHHYTMDKSERDNLIKLGWKDEGIGWYNVPSNESNRIPLYRQFNPNVEPTASRNNSGSHNYTLSESENNNLVKAGWRAEGVAWYSYPVSFD